MAAEPNKISLNPSVSASALESWAKLLTFQSFGALSDTPPRTVVKTSLEGTSVPVP